MTYSLNLTPSAIDDIQIGLGFYNNLSNNLGFKFVDEVSSALEDIATMPTAYGYRYKKVRGKQVHKFPYLIFLYNRFKKYIR